MLQEKHLLSATETENDPNWYTNSISWLLKACVTLLPLWTSSRGFNVSQAYIGTNWAYGPIILKSLVEVGDHVRSSFH